MSLAIRDVSIVPPGAGWAYYVEATNFTVTTKIYSQIYPLVIQHCQSNNVSAPSWQQVVDQMCQNLHIPCYNDESGSHIANKWSLNLPVPIPVGCCGRA